MSGRVWGSIGGIAAALLLTETPEPDPHPRYSPACTLAPGSTWGRRSSGSASSRSPSPRCA